MKTITVDEFLQFNPCYPEERIREIADTHDGKTEWSALDILALEDVPAIDRLWAVLREALIDAPILHTFACDCAERALASVENPDPRSVAAVETKRRWLRDEAPNEEFSAALNAARSAAQDAAEYAPRDVAECAACSAALNAAEYAAWDSVQNATWNAAQAAAWSAVRSTTWSAAECAAWDAARDAEHEVQIDILRELLQE
jgi:hypothetical protein